MTWRYAKTLARLKKNPASYIDYIQKDRPNSIDKLNRIHKITPAKIKKTKEYQEVISDEASKCVDIFLKNLKNKRRGYQLGKEFPNFVKTYKPYLNDETTKKIAEKLPDLLPEFYPYARKDLLAVASEWVQGETLALALLEKNYRTLDDAMIEKLVGQIENGYEHDTIKRLASKGMAFKAHKYNNLDPNDPATRKEIINNIAQTPTLISKLKYNIHLTLDDIKQLPPARRFDFLRTLYEPIMKPFISKYSSYNRYSYGRRYNSTSKDSSAKNIALRLINIGFGLDTKTWASKISIDPIDVKDIEGLLFSVAIQKNEQVVKWLEQYKEYLSKRAEVKKIIQGIYNWL